MKSPNMTGQVIVRKRRTIMIWKKRRMKISRMSVVRRRMMKVSGMTMTKGSGARRKNRMIASDLVSYLKNEYI
jgi:hypothetical protein